MQSFLRSRHPGLRQKRKADGLQTAFITLGLATRAKLPRDNQWVYGKCGIREFYFEDDTCPWKTSPIIDTDIGGVVRVATMPESCWYDRDRYHLHIHKFGDTSQEAQKLTSDDEEIRDSEIFVKHPQCHIELKMVVIPRPHPTNDPQPWGFKTGSNGLSVRDNDGDVVEENDSKFSHHMDNYDSAVTAAQNAWEFVRPRGWPQEGPPSEFPDNMDDIEDYYAVSMTDNPKIGDILMGPKLTIARDA